MSNYVQSTNFATKDALSSGDPLKIVKGTEINTEFNNIAVAVETKADLVSPTLATPTLVNPALGTPVSGNLANCTFPTLNQNTTGNAATATALKNARTIGGVSFNGTADINLPGVNEAGDQDTSGNAATATNATNAENAENAENADTVTTITTDQVLEATAAAAFGAVGTYAFLRPTATTDITQGSTHAGSGLRPNGGLTSSLANVSMLDGTAPAGTWRAMGRRRLNTNYGLDSAAATLFLRIS